jgi:hypothetical protein
VLCTCFHFFQRAFAASAGIEGGKNLAESAQDLERTRKAINVQLAEFDGVKKSLIRDLQNRCEKVNLSVILFKAMEIVLTFFFPGGCTGNTVGRDEGTV